MTAVSSLLPGIPTIESPLFEAMLPQLDLSEQERQVARDLNQRGYAVIDFPDPEILARIDRIQARLLRDYPAALADPAADKLLGDLRIQDAWKHDADVKAIAANADVLSLLSRLYGRRAFPFQTLNFPVGTQQPAHSDAVHFSSQPERFMCGVWVAFEDIHPDAGPLEYYPGSHRWPILSNVLVGRRGWGQPLASAQTPFEDAWSAMVAAAGLAPERFMARKGQALIWAANLLHGGSRQADATRTRWSQVTHYFFDDCIYYTPAFSDEPIGKLDMRTITDIGTGAAKPNLFLGERVDTVPVASAGSQSRGGVLRRLERRLAGKAKGRS